MPGQFQIMDTLEEKKERRALKEAMYEFFMESVARSRQNSHMMRNYQGTRRSTKDDWTNESMNDEKPAIYLNNLATNLNQNKFPKLTNPWPKQKQQQQQQNGSFPKLRPAKLPGRKLTFIKKTWKK